MMLNPGTGCGCCESFLYVLFVCNSNSALDDNFEAVWDKSDWGAINLSTNTCCGRAWTNQKSFTGQRGANALSAALGNLCCNGDSSFGGLTYEDFNLWSSGLHTFYMNNIQVNFNGNFGVVRLVDLTEKSKDVFVVRNIWLSANYQGDDGSSFSFPLGPLP